MKKYNDEWDNLFDDDYKKDKVRIWNKEWWKFDKWDDLGFKSINRLSFEKYSRWGRVVNGYEEYYLRFNDIIDNKRILKNNSGRILRWIRKYYLKVIFIGLMFRMLWRVSIWIWNYSK